MVGTNCVTYADPQYNICNIGLHELLLSRTHEVTPRGDTWSLQFVVTNTTEECEVADRLAGRVTDNDGNQTIMSELGIYPTMYGQPLRDWRIQRIGYLVWMVDAVYGYKGLTVMPGRTPWPLMAEQLRASNIQSSTIGGTKHITKNLWTVSWSERCPKMWGAIEWDGKAVKGIDVPAAAGRWREVWKFSMKDVFDSDNPWPHPPDIHPGLAENNEWQLEGLSLFQRWHKMTGWVHGYDWWLQVDEPCATAGHWRSKKFRGFEQGALQFLGAEVTQMDTYNCEVTFEFQFEPNHWEPIPATISGAKEYTPPDRDCQENDATYKGPEILFRGSSMEAGTEVYVHGFDYFQVWYENNDIIDADDEDEPDDGTVVAPVARHWIMHQVHRYCPFEWLGIPNLPMWDGIRTQSPEYQAYIGTCGGAPPYEIETAEAGACIKPT